MARPSPTDLTAVVSSDRPDLRDAINHVNSEACPEFAFHDAVAATVVPCRPGQHCGVRSIRIIASSAEGTDTNLLTVFDGLYLFSAAQWGLKDGTIRNVDQSFRSRINAFNVAHRRTKVWAAGVEPGYDDTRVPSRTGAHRIPRDGGVTYRLNWAS